MIGPGGFMAGPKGNQMTSIGSMIKRIAGLMDTKDVSDFENRFIANMLIKTNHGNDTRELTEKQLQVIENIYGKHFA